MKDLSKRFINIHSGIGPLATVEASKGVLVDQQVRGISSYPHIINILISSHINILISSHINILISSHLDILISSYPRWHPVVFSSRPWPAAMPNNNNSSSNTSLSYLSPSCFRTLCSRTLVGGSTKVENLTKVRFLPWVTFYLNRHR